MAPSTVMPKNWKDFLRVDQNKTEIFGVLSREAIRLPIADGKEMYATCGTEVLCFSAESDLTSLAPCSHEEADTRTDVVQEMRTVAIHTVLTGCDTVSSFTGRGKKTACEILKVFPEVTDAFEELLCMPSDVSEDSLSLLERFVVLMYDIMEVNDAWKQLFTLKSMALYPVPRKTFDVFFE